LWRTAQQTPKKRYDTVMHDLQMIGQRDLLCGLHVHVELPDPDERVEVMYRMMPYLPLLLALSTSSPFWQGRCTGLKGYRLAAYDELPRTGVPELFRTREEFDAYVAALVRAGVIKDSSYIWWAIRPSLSNPTLELRAPDTCTMVEDGLAIAALYRTIARHLCINRWRNADLDAVQRALIVENKWRAQRYGVQGTFVTEKGAVPVAETLDHLIDDTRADAEALGCLQVVDQRRELCGRREREASLDHRAEQPDDADDAKRHRQRSADEEDRHRGDHHLAVVIEPQRLDDQRHNKPRRHGKREEHHALHSLARGFGGRLLGHDQIPAARRITCRPRSWARRQTDVL
jgi:carboxylate-amine ligase